MSKVPDKKNKKTVSPSKIKGQNYMSCPLCEHINRLNAKFCGKCGIRFQASKTQSMMPGDIRSQIDKAIEDKMSQKKQKKTQSSPKKKKKIIKYVKKKKGSSSKKEVVPVKKEVISVKKKEVLPVKTKEVIFIKKKEVFPDKKKEVFPDKKKEVLPVKEKEVLPDKKKEVLPVKDKEVLPVKDKEVLPVKEKEGKKREEPYFEKYLICPSCDKSNRYNASFCGKCGFNLQGVRKTIKAQEAEIKPPEKQTYLEKLEGLVKEANALIKGMNFDSESSKKKLKKVVQNMSPLVNQVKVRYKEEDRFNTEKLSLINAIVRAVNQSLDLDKILDTTLEKALFVTRADTGVMMVTDKETKQLIPMAFQGVSPVLVEEIKQAAPKLDTGTHGRAYLLGKTVKVEQSPASSPLTDALVLKGSLLSILCVPLKSENEVVGIMSIGSRRPNAFSEEDMKTLDSIGNQIGIALRNARLYALVKNQVQELEEKNTKLKELEEMKNNLTQMIVHDLKNPLTGITGYIELLMLDRIKYNEEQLMAINMISVSCNKLMRMILNLLDIGKMEENRLKLRKSEISMDVIIDKIIDEFKPLLNLDNKKILKLSEPVPPFYADKDLVTRIIANLLSNAIRYSPPDKSIKIVTYTNEEDTELTFSIEDEGIGIDEEYHEKIFDKFFQAGAKKDSGSVSRGIGLAFCKMAVEAHGGKIWVKSKAGIGSKFYFTLPLAS